MVPLFGVFRKDDAFLLGWTGSSLLLLKRSRGEWLTGGDTHILVKKPLVGLLDMNPAAYAKPFAFRSGPLPAPSSSTLVRLPFV